MFDLNNSDQVETFYRTSIRQSLAGVRVKSLQRLVALHQIIEYECVVNQGEAFKHLNQKSKVNITNRKQFIQKMDFETFCLLKDAANTILDPDEVDFILDISKRSALDYVYALKRIYILKDGRV